MEKLKRKTIEQSGVRKGSPMEGVGVFGGKDLRKRYLLSLELKKVGVMDNDSVDDGTDGLIIIDLDLIIIIIVVH